MTEPNPPAQDAVQERWGKEDFQKKLERAFWMNHPVVLQHLNRLATGRPDCDWLTWFTHDCIPQNRAQRVLVLGCGEGWLERSIARLDWIERIDAFDVAEGAVDRARERAREEGLDKIHYGVLDLNVEAVEEDLYDVVIAHSVLHHIEGLEHAFETIQKSLKPEAWIAISEYVGPPHLQYRDEAMSLMNRVMAALEPRLRSAIISGGTLDEKVRPELDYILKVDPSEGVRADELDDFIHSAFDVVYQRPMGGTVLQHLLWEMVGNFDPDDLSDNCLLEWICLLEESVIEWSTMPSDYQFYVCRRQGTDTGSPVESRTLVKSVPERLSTTPDSSWRTRPVATAHFHQLATGNGNCDWFTSVLGELEAVGVKRQSRILWLGGEEWMLNVLTDRFERVETLSKTLLLTAFGQFDAAFGCRTGLLDGARSRRLAGIGFLLKKTGAVVSIEGGAPQPDWQQWIDRFAPALARVAGTEGLPRRDVPTRQPQGLPDLFQIERTTELGGDLLEPLFDTYADKTPRGRLDDLIRLLSVVETEALSAGCFESSTRGVLLAGPRRRRLLRSMF